MEKDTEIQRGTLERGRDTKVPPSRRSYDRVPRNPYKWVLSSSGRLDTVETIGSGLHRVIVKVLKDK